MFEAAVCGEETFSAIRLASLCPLLGTAPFDKLAPSGIAFASGKSLAASDWPASAVSCAVCPSVACSCVVCSAGAFLKGAEIKPNAFWAPWLMTFANELIEFFKFAISPAIENVGIVKNFVTGLMAYAKGLAGFLNSRFIFSSSAC